MSSWTEFETAEPDLASRVRARFERTGLALMATIRADGSPRISGVEPLFTLGDLYLGMMPQGRKSADLQRDPRLALHNATVDKAVLEGDVKISGRAETVTDPDTRSAYRAAFEAENGEAPPEGEIDLWSVDIGEIAVLSPAGDHLRIETWRPGRPRHEIKRY